MQFSGKNWQNNRLAPSWRPLLRKILDPPLIRYTCSHVTQDLSFYSLINKNRGENIGSKIFLISCIFFLTFGKIICWRPPPGWLALPPTKYPESASLIKLSVRKHLFKSSGKNFDGGRTSLWKFIFWNWFRICYLFLNSISKPRHTIFLIFHLSVKFIKLILLNICLWRHFWDKCFV